MSDLALHLIAENKKTRETFLDLGNCGLTEIPAEIGELVWLEYLSLASEWKQWDGEKWAESKSQNTGDKNDCLVDIASLANLTALQTLDISNTQIVDLAPLANLTALRELDLSKTPVTDLTPLAGLTGLQGLDISETRVANLSPLAGLTALQFLNISTTPVTDLTRLAGLTGLQGLDISETRVESRTSHRWQA